jgi:soluble lytic murein transglycosylase-like protein
MKRAIWQMVAAILIGLAIFIPLFLLIDAGVEAEQAEKCAKPTVYVVEKCAETTTTTEKREIISYYDSIPLDKELQNHIINQAHAKGIPPQIVMAMIDRESDYNITCMGDGGDSYGLMQIQPKWHSKRMEKLGCTDLLDPYQNVVVGIDYLAELLDRYDGDMAKAVTAYNRGHYAGTITAYAKGVMAKAEELGGANIYEYSR